MVTLKFTLGFTLLFCLFQYSNPNSFNILATANEYQILNHKLQEKTDLEKSITKGKEVYTDFCMQCHMANGNGDGTNFPPLDGSDWLTKKTNESIHSIKFGLTGEILVNGKKFNNTMNEMGLSNQEIADVMNYIRNSWGNKNPKMISLKQVEAIKK